MSRRIFVSREVDLAVSTDLAFGDPVVDERIPRGSEPLVYVVVPLMRE